tara:strand:- start:2483 stop:3670 length:1188 start_codon:yes stop_codon:yes gene_type:complete
LAYTAIKSWLTAELDDIRSNGLFKNEQVIETPQGARVTTSAGPRINFCANNYLGLADHPEILEAVRAGLQSHGYGMASVRFICGTQDIHKELEARISRFLSTEDTLLYSSCFDANTGLFETLLGREDAVISDELNHASIIDGIRLCRADRKRYKHSDMADLEAKLQETAYARFRMIATDGVFSMQGDLAKLKEICELADQYDAMVMVDDSHSTGFVGPGGRGTPAQMGVEDRVDIITSTLGKGLGGASGGFTTGHSEIVSYLRQRSRPYLFSNSLPPLIAIGAVKALELVDEQPELRARLWENTRYFRERMTGFGFELIPGDHPIVPVMLRDELKTVEMAAAMNRRGVFVVGFNYPVVPRGAARIRVQVSAAHTRTELDKALDAFQDVGAELGLI